MKENESRKVLRAEYEKFREQYLLKNERRIEEKKKEMLRREKFKKSLRVLKKRVFNPKNIATGLLIGTTIFTTSCKANESSNAIDAIRDLKFEVEVHGGVKDINSDKFIHNLSEHVESGTCNIQNNGTDIEDRISEYCNVKDLPECVKVAAIEKFHYYMSNDYVNGDKINLSSIYNKYNKNPEENIKLSNGDEITIDDGVVTYVYNDEKSNGLSR